jgi:hypothetical protein
MKKWVPKGSTQTKIIELVNKKYLPKISLGKSIENRDDIILSMGFDLLMREIEVEHYRSLVKDIWESYINLTNKNPMTEDEQKGYGNYEKRLFDIFWKEVGDVLEKQHIINYAEVDMK